MTISIQLTIKEEIQDSDFIFIQIKKDRNGNPTIYWQSDCGIIYNCKTDLNEPVRSLMLI
jgi:hypothetical protein